MKFIMTLALAFLPLTSFALHPACQSNSRCLYSKLPYYTQTDDALEAYVGKQIGIANYTDKGMCVPTSVTILLSGVLGERHSKTKLTDSYLAGFESRKWYENIYQFGKKAKTDFKNGGTAVRNVEDIFKSYIKDGIKAYKGTNFDSSGMRDMYNSNYDATDIIGKIKKYKLGFIIGVQKLSKHNYKILWKKLTYYKYETGHAMVIKGFDGDRLHIQDPYGMDYFAKIKKEKIRIQKFGLKQKQSIFTSISGTSGFMYKANKAGLKLVLDEVLGLRID